MLFFLKIGQNLKKKMGLKIQIRTAKHIARVILKCTDFSIWGLQTGLQTVQTLVWLQAVEEFLIQYFFWNC